LDHHLHFADEVFALATCGPYLIVVWRGAPDRPRLERLLALAEEHAKAIGGPIGMVGVIEEGSPPPDPDDAAFLVPRFETLAGTTVLAAAAVLEARTEAPDLRAVAESLSGALGQHIVMKMCFAPEEACTWIIPRLVPQPEPSLREELARSIEQTRASILVRDA
jgi:hypothetical protein